MYGRDAFCPLENLINFDESSTAKKITQAIWSDMILLETLRTLKKGGTFAIHDIMSKVKYGDMQEFVKKLKNMGYAEVELVDTTNGMFMSKWESAWMGLSGSAVLMGRK